MANPQVETITIARGHTLKDHNGPVLAREPIEGIAAFIESSTKLVRYSRPE